MRPHEDIGELRSAAMTRRSSGRVNEARQAFADRTIRSLADPELLHSLELAEAAERETLEQMAGAFR